MSELERAARLYCGPQLPPFYRALRLVDTGRTEIVDDPHTREPYYFILMAKELAR